MEWNTDFELTRLLRLLTERLVPGCLERRLRAEDIESLIQEIRFEGDKIYVEVMKVMCRPHGEVLLRRYLEVHLHGAAHLQQRADEMLSKAGEGCIRLLEAFKGVLEGVLNWLGNWQKRYFCSVPVGQMVDPAEVGVLQTVKWMSQEEVMEKLGVSRRTLHSYRKEGMIEGRRFRGKMQYTQESVMRIK